MLLFHQIYKYYGGKIIKKTILLTLIFTMLSFDTGKEIDKNSETNNCIVNAKETINQDYIFKINEEKIIIMNMVIML